jgi:hypothetical protein
MPLPKIIPIERIEIEEIVPLEIVPGWEKYPSWNITELEDFFKTHAMHNRLVRLNPCTTIIDVPKFIESHLSIIRAHNGEERFQPYYDRLQELKEYMAREFN